MQNGWRHEVGGFAPETALGTGADEPLVDEFEAAKEVPSVDENTVGTGAQNKPRGTKSIDYSGEDVGDSGTGPVESNGKDYETREVIEDPHADDAEVNQPAADVRPEAPQETKASRKKKDTV